MCYSKSIFFAIAALLFVSCVGESVIEYPTDIKSLSDNLELEPDGTANLSFRVSPDDADVNIRMLYISEEASSGMSPAEKYKVSAVVPRRLDDGSVISGQYIASVQDNGISENYSEKARLVARTDDGLVYSDLFNVTCRKSNNILKNFRINGYRSQTIDSYITVKVPYDADLTSMTATFDLSDGKAYVGQKEQKSGVTVNDFSAPVEYRIVRSNGKEYKYLVSICFSELPAVYINTPSNYPVYSKDIWIEGSKMYVTNAAEKGWNMVYENMNVRGRGNSTWNFPKKPYAVKLDKREEVMGMPEHKRWVLLANWLDRTCMRNAVAFEIARKTGLDWTSRGEFVDFVLNGRFLGNYYLCEQIRIDENRVNIAEMTSEDLAEESITGGYLLELDTNFDEPNRFRSNHGYYHDVNENYTVGLPVMIKNPDENVLQQTQFNYIKNYFCSAEAAIWAYDFASTGAYRNYIDVDTFIDWWLIHELAQNGEPSHPKSSYMHKDRNGKLKAGPVWDFDWGTFRRDNKRYYSKDAIWYNRLFMDPYFVSRVKQRWAELKPGFESVLDYIDDTSSYIRSSADANASIWPDITNSVNEDNRMNFTDAVSRMRAVYDERIK